MSKKEYNKQYYEDNKEKLLKQQGEYCRRKKKENPVHILYIRLKSRAKEKGLDFNLEESDIKIPDKCPILDIPLFFSEGVQTSNSPSMDRIDSSKGYVKGNVGVISNKANAHKSNMTLEQVRRLLKYMEGK